MLLPLLLVLQTTPVAPVEKGTGLPPPAQEEAAVLAPIDGVFAALAARDGPAAMQHVRPEGRFTAAVERPDGSRSIRVMTSAEWAADLKPGAERLEERLVNPAIEIDGDIAMVWSNYTFTIDGKFSHCGVDHFDLVREGGSWKILNITWTQRTAGCQ
jgi:hypothetical protein